MNEEDSPLEPEKKTLGKVYFILGSYLLLVLVMIFSTFVGPVRIPFLYVAQIYGTQIPFLGQFIPHNFAFTQYEIVVYLREPEVIGGVVVGASLGIGGAAIQSVFRNPITEPYIIGLSSGASLGAVTAIVFGLTLYGFYTVQAFAFLSSMAVVTLVYLFSFRGGMAHPTYLLLTGVAFSLLISSIVALLIFTNITLQGEAFFWLLGSLQNITWPELDLVVVIVLISSILIGNYYRELNAMQMGEAHARAVGVNVESVKRNIFFLVALSVSAAVSISGLIGFVGLVIPHISRSIYGGSNKYVIPSSAAIGAIFLLLADDIARSIVTGIVIPIGIVTGIAGVPFFLYFLNKLGGARNES